METSILWRRLDRPGHEWARLVSQGSDRHLLGAAVFLHEGRPCRLSYKVLCDSDWRTLSAGVSGWVGEEKVEIELSVDSESWSLNGRTIEAVKNCVDLDLNFSPSTNLLPIRRLRLDIGQEAAVRAAWLRFPSFRLEPLDQVYHRTGPSTYRYESAGGRFVADLEVNEEGFVTHYPGFADLETSG